MKYLSNIKLVFVFSYLFMAVLASSCRKEEMPNGNEDPNKSPFAVEIGDSKIPYLVINTKGKDILNEPKVAAQISIYSEKQLIKSQSIGIEFKGKTSFRLSNKKSFSIESWDAIGNDSTTTFFDFPEEEDFLLTGQVVNTTDKFIFDRTMMYNDIAYELSRSIGRYASKTKFVELEINGKYQGLYSFMEKLKRDKNRIDIKSLNANSTNVTGGYILTIDKSSIGDEGIGKPASYFDTNWDDDAKYTERNSFRSNYDINKNLLQFPPYNGPYHPQQYLETYFLYEYPNQDDITADQKAYIQKYMNDFETALINDNFGAGEHSYQNYIDLPSFVDYFLLNELCKNIDAFRLSTYLQKDRDGKLAMGPIWDMNIGFDEGDRIPMNDWVINYNNYVSQDPWMMVFWWPRLLEDPDFRNAVKSRWTTLRTNELSTSKMQAIVDANVNYLKSNGAISRNYKLWDQGIGVNYEDSINKLKDFLKNRSAWMDGQIANF